MRGFDQEEMERNWYSTPEMRPDLRSYTIWDTIQNTIEDPDLTLYLVLDEAHRGMGNPANAEKSKHHRSTAHQRRNGVPGIPVVWVFPQRWSASTMRWKAAESACPSRT